MKDNSIEEGVSKDASEKPSQIYFYALALLTIPMYTWLLVTESIVAEDLYQQLTEIYIVIWLLLPILVYLDIRAVKKSTSDWNPKTANWLIGMAIPLLNAGVLIPYLLRHYEKGVKMETWNYWWRIAGISVVIPFLALLLNVLLLDLLLPGNESIEGFMTAITMPLFIFSTALAPVSMKYDIDYIEPRVNWEPDRPVYIYLSAIWLINFFIVLAYTLKRNPESEWTAINDKHQPDQSSEDPVDQQLDKDPGLQELITKEQEHQSTTDPSEIDSQWWIIPALTTALTILLLLLGIAMAALYIYLDPSYAYMMIWPVFPLIIILGFLAILSIIAMYLDAKEINEANTEWKPSGLLYLIAAVLTSPVLVAVIYTVQRHRHLGVP